MAQEAAESAAAGILAQPVDEVYADGTIELAGRRLVNFGSCSYLGLCRHPSLEHAALEAIRRYGVSFSSSRVYARLSLYDDLEQRLGRIVGGAVVAAGSTTLAHLSALPALVSGRDAVVVDRQAHTSLHLATQVLAARGIPVIAGPHVDMTALDVHVADLAQRHPRVWYLADSVYSMYGDVAPMDDIVASLERHPSMMAYIDDAHGFGWAGAHGRGIAIEHGPIHPRMLVSFSLSKSFGAGGGAVAAADAETAQLLLMSGGPLWFGGPIQTAELGAGVAAADLLLSDWHQSMQTELYRRIDFVACRAAELEIPLVSTARTPIWFLKVGSLDQTREVIARVMDDGFWVNLSGFPAVPPGMAGIRFTNTLMQSIDQIDGLLTSIARHMAEVVSGGRMVVTLSELAVG
jgi:7-keto-8-aminopelargonate synthetase-like enzyme